MKENIKRAHMCVAHIYAQLSYCKRRQVGCLIVQDNRIISIGYNGTPPGWDNICEDETGKTYSYVYHAEANAISKLARSPESGEGASLFVTTAPCFECAKLLAQVGIKEVYYCNDTKTHEAIDFLLKCGISVVRVDVNKEALAFALKNEDIFAFKNSVEEEKGGEVVLALKNEDVLFSKP